MAEAPWGNATNQPHHPPLLTKAVIITEFERLLSIPPKNPNLLVKVTEMGNIVEVQYMSKRNNKQTVQMLEGGEQFVILSTGEIKDIEHHDTRQDNKKGLYKTFANARAIINTNVTDVSKVRWCTLTYAENMMDTVKLYKDFEKFNKRFQYYCKTKGYSKPEYIVMMEPQGRGAWHAHLLYIWQDQTAPYIPNDDFRELWGHGFVRIKKLDNVDNVGAYLTAYLGDMEINDLNNVSASELFQCADGVKVKEVETEDESGKRVKKSILKGARLNLYPANFNMIRCSRGIKRPIEELVTQDEAKEKVLGATKTFETAVKLTDKENEFETVIIKTQYNKARRKKQ
jgi:hypothetical protein